MCLFSFLSGIGCLSSQPSEHCQGANPAHLPGANNFIDIRWLLTKGEQDSSRKACNGNSKSEHMSRTLIIVSAGGAAAL